MLSHKLYFVLTLCLLSCGPNKKQEAKAPAPVAEINWNHYSEAEFALNRLKTDLDYFLRHGLDTLTSHDAAPFEGAYSPSDIKALGYDSFDEMVRFSIDFPSKKIAYLICQINNVVKSLQYLRASQGLSHEIQKDRASRVFDEYVDLSGHCYAFTMDGKVSEFPWIPSFEEDLDKTVSGIFADMDFLK